MYLCQTGHSEIQNSKLDMKIWARYVENDVWLLDYIGKNYLIAS